MGNKRIYAGIVSYNPEMGRLKENLEGILPQTDAVIVFENGSRRQAEICKELDKYDGIKVIISNRNQGIAAALNALMQWGKDNGYEWMLALDQDSVCERSYIHRMEPYLETEDTVGIVAPVIVDRNIGIVGHNPQKEYAHVNTCITSGSLVSIEKWDEIGQYDEQMFIDSVDFEFCYRMRKHGYGVIQVRDVRLLHEIGSCRIHRFLFWNVRLSGHSAFRQYYIARNNIYYPRKHHLALHLIRGNLRNLWLIVKLMLYEKEDRHAKVSAVKKGWKDGLTGVINEN